MFYHNYSKIKIKQLVIDVKQGENPVDSIFFGQFLLI